MGYVEAKDPKLDLEQMAKIVQFREFGRTIHKCWDAFSITLLHKIIYTLGSASQFS